MKPYFEEDGITIYHGDCREILPTLPPCDLICTDPPYNCGKDYGTHNDSMSDADYADWCDIRVRECLRLAPNQFWVAPRYRLPLWLSLLPDSHLVVIPRGAQGPSRAGWGDQFEIALAIGKPNRQIADLWTGIRLKGEGYFFREETWGHPGYTPSPIMRKAIRHLSENSVIDPFSGTGTTLRAAKDLGRRAIGIEIEERYCEIAANRLRQGVLFANDAAAEREAERGARVKDSDYSYIPLTPAEYPEFHRFDSAAISGRLFGLWPRFSREVK